MQSVEHRRFYQSLILIFKCIKGSGAVYIFNLFDPRQWYYNLRNIKHKFIPQCYNNRYYPNSFTYKTSHLWNQLPTYLPSSELSDFHKNLRSINL